MQKVYRICYSTSQTDSKIHKEEIMYNNYQGTFKERKKVSTAIWPIIYQAKL